MTALQTMLLQADGNQFYLFPAWPKGWNVSFKLHAPGNTTVQGRYRDGNLLELSVEPEARRSQLTVLTPQ